MCKRCSLSRDRKKGLLQMHGSPQVLSVQLFHLRPAPHVLVEIGEVGDLAQCSNQRGLLERRSHKFASDGLCNAVRKNDRDIPAKIGDNFFRNGLCEPQLVV